MTNKTKFCWASIHGADPEPVEKTEHDGRPCVYTIGCPDPFYLDEKPCPVLLLDEPRMDRPQHPDKAAAERAAAEADADLAHAARMRGHKTYVNSAGRRVITPLYHGWRGPR